MIHQSVLSALGHTPLIRINRIFSKPGVTLAAKLESKNPGGSIKDRVACAMVEAAEERGELIPGKTIIEATSGNTGIGLAMVCAVKGYKLKLLMPASASEERKRIMRAYGAEIMLTPGHLGTDGAIEEAYRLAREEPDTYVLMDQFNNPASIQAHYRTTAMEIWEATGGEVTHVVATLGTTGTAMGLVTRLKELSPAVSVVAIEPHPGHKIQGLKNMRESYPPGIYNKKALDKVVHVEDEAAFAMCRRLAREEGLFVGMSSGAAMAGAVRLAESLQSGLVVVILPDSGERYLSTPLFAEQLKRGLAVFDLASGEKIHPETGGAAPGLFTFGPSLDTPGDPEAWRRIVFLDVLGRYLESQGMRAEMAAGLADCDDRTVLAAHRAGKTRGEFAASVQAKLLDTAKALGVSERMGFPLAARASETCLTLTAKLTRKGYAYERLRSVYFDTARDKTYGDLLHTDLEKLSLGKTVDLEAYDKANPKDFTLLKRVTLQDLKKGEVWATEWGNVRPSWFLQMAALAVSALPRLTLVLAGETHTFPHLDNLRSIFALGAGIAPQIWTLARGVSGLDDIAVPFVHPKAVRLWLLSVAQRRPLPYSKDAMAMWQRNWRKIQDTAALLAEAVSESGKPGPEAAALAEKLGASLTACADDDLSLHHFWPSLFTFLKSANTMLAAGTLSGADARALLAAMTKADAVLGVLDLSAMPVPAASWPKAVAELVEKRAKARSAKDFAAADAIRAELLALGLRLEDTPRGMRLFRL